MANWTLAAPSAAFLGRLKLNEGSAEYQAKLGYFKNGKFRVYKCSEGYPTIGYGHLVLPGEDFSQGITEAQAEQMLIKDSANAFADAKDIAVLYNLNVPERVQEVLVEMVFQLGKRGVLKFKKFLSALASNNFNEAVLQLKDSTWYRQTPNRVEGHIKTLNECRGK